MKLSVYLMRTSVKNFEDILQTKQLEGAVAFKKLGKTAKLPYTCKAYIQVNKKSEPKWAGFLGSHFNMKGMKLRNQTNSFVLLVKRGGRFFAVTFGHGFQAIDPAKIEPRFGLMVAVNCLKDLSGLETNLIDRLTSNKKLHLGKSSRISEFGLNPQIDWIRRMSGAPPINGVAKSVSGSDSCCIGVDCDLDSVGAKCAELFDLFKSDDYKKVFEFLDQLQPIGKHDPRISILEPQLGERLEDRSYDRISIAFPEMPNEEALDHYKVSCGVSMDLQELTLEGIYEFLDETKLAADPDKIYVVGIGDNDAAVTRRRCLRDYLACEFDHGKETFRFQAENDYVKKIRAEVAALDDVTKTLALRSRRESHRLPLPVRLHQASSCGN